jgi:sec-independent protein translocase protein TatA
MPTGWQEWLLVIVVVLLLFGAKRLPEIAQGLGKGIKEFKRAMKDTSDEIKGSLDVNQNDKSQGAKPGQTNDKTDDNPQKN